MEERGGGEGRRLRSPNKKPHFLGPEPTAQACLLPRRHPHQPLTAGNQGRISRLSCHGDWCTCLPLEMEVGVRLGKRVTLATGDWRQEGSLGGAGPRLFPTGAGRRRRSDWTRRTVALPLDALRNGVAGDG